MKNQSPLLLIIIFPLIIFPLIIILPTPSLCCTNFLLTPTSTSTGSSIISYNADSFEIYRSISLSPGGPHPPGSLREIYNWESGAYMGTIEEPNTTYRVTGNMNEHQVTIGESTFGGVDILQSQRGAIIDYGSLMYLALERSRTAREAVTVMGELVMRYGYASTGESFSIGDPREVWYMELIGRGEGELGAVWVGVRLPPGTLSAHANQARITTFYHYNPEDCVYSSDIVEFAKGKGLYPESGRLEDFSFSGVFGPVTVTSARLCEGRVWGFFDRVVGGDGGVFGLYCGGEFES